LQLSTKKYLISFCVLLLLGAFAVSTLVFAQAASTLAAASPSSGNGYGWAHGCPSNSVVGKTPKPNVTVTQQQANTTITVHTGNLISFQFPFGSRWGGPTTSQGNLALQGPAGYAVRTAQLCVWRFVAKGPGTTQLNFTRSPLCKPNQPCPFMSMLVPFTVKVN
jgi:hypothetical protein